MWKGLRRRLPGLRMADMRSCRNAFAYAPHPRPSYAPCTANGCSPTATCRYFTTSGATWCAGKKAPARFCAHPSFYGRKGHTVHTDEESAEEETLKMLGVYEEFAKNVLAIPVVTGRKSEKEKFAGALKTYTMEALMKDGKALQMGTSHNFGMHFAKVFDIQYLDRDGQLKYAWQTSWGTSTRMIGGLIMVHGDDRGFMLPPKVAPIQAIVIPIAAHKEGVLEKARR